MTDTQNPMQHIIEEVPLSEIVFEERVKGVHDAYNGQPEGQIYILRDGHLIRVLPVVFAGRKVFFFDINHKFDADTVHQVWRIRPAVIAAADEPRRSFPEEVYLPHDDVTPEGIAFLRERAAPKLEGKNFKHVSGLKLVDPATGQK